MDEQPHILVVDDDRRLRELLRKYLADHGFTVSVAKDAAEARAHLGIVAVDLAVVDVMMPGEDGLSLTAHIASSNGPPVLLLTAMGETLDRIKGLESGADDYLSKPFEPRELLLRIGVILRRKTSVPEAAPKPEMRLGVAVWDLSRQELRVEGEPVRLTTAETQLLAILAAQPGTPVSRDDLAAGTGAESNPRAVDVQVTRLRRKFELDPRNPRYLQTVRGEGYLLRPDP